MIWRERNLLLLLVLSGVVLSQNDRKVRNFFSRARSGAQLPVGGEQFQGNVLRIGRRQDLRQAEETSEQEIVALETSSAAELAREDLSRAQVAPASDARVRPEVELEHSIQGQVAEALIRDSLTGRTLTGPPTRPEGHSPDGIRSRLIQRPVQRPVASLEPSDSTENSDNISDNEREEIARFRASRPSRIRPLVPAPAPESRREESERIEASQVSIQPRRIVQPQPRGSPQQPPQSRRADIRRPESPALRAPASIRPAVLLEVDAMMKKHSAALRLQAGSDKMEEINRNLLVAKLNTHMAEKENALEKAEAQAAASSENSRLAAEIEELRARLLKAEEALVGRSQAPVDANNNLADRAREISQFRSRQPSRPRSFDGQPRQPEKARQPDVRPKDNTPVYQPGSFFGRNSQIPTLPLRQQLPALPRQPIQMVKVQDIQVPKFSKMVKNVGLRLLPSDERSIPVEEIATPSRSNPQTSDLRLRQQQLAPRRNSQQRPEPAVQGFKIPQQQSQQLAPVPLSRQFSRFQQQSQIQRQLPQVQQARFQETPRFETVRERLEAQIPRYEPPPQNNQPTPDVPGIEAHLAEQNKIINLQRTQAEKAATLERRRLGLEQPPQQVTQPQQNFNQQPQQNFQQLQQSYQQQAIQNQQPQQQNLIPQVPGLQEHQAALQQHLATIQQFNAQRPEHQSQPQQQQPVPQFQPQPTPQFQPQPTQFQQPPSQQQIPGLEQHARFVSELQAAQQALGTR